MKLFKIITGIYYLNNKRTFSPMPQTYWDNGEKAVEAVSATSQGGLGYWLCTLAGKGAINLISLRHFGEVIVVEFDVNGEEEVLYSPNSRLLNSAVWERKKLKDVNFAGGYEEIKIFNKMTSVNFYKVDVTKIIDFMVLFYDKLGIVDEWHHDVMISAVKKNRELFREKYKQFLDAGIDSPEKLYKLLQPIGEDEVEKLYKENSRRFEYVLEEDYYEPYDYTDPFDNPAWDY